MIQAPDIQVRFEALKSYARLLKVITKNSFDDQWTEIFNFSWNKIKIAQSYIEKIGFAEDISDIQADATPAKSGKLKTSPGDIDEDLYLLNPIEDSGDLAEIEEIKVELEDCSNDSKVEDPDLEESKEAVF